MTQVSEIKQRLKQVFTPVIISTSLILGTLSPLFLSTAASATPITATPGVCATNMDQWDWPKSEQTNTGWNYAHPGGLSPFVGGSGSGFYPQFDYAQTSWVVYKDLSSGNTQLAFASGDRHLVFQKNTTTGNYYVVVSDPSFSMFDNNVVDTPKSTGSSTWDTHIGGGVFRTTIDLQQVSCISAKNVQYDGNYDLAKATNNISYTAQDTACGKLDLSCQVSKVFQFFTSAFQDLIHGIASIIQWLMVPDSDAISSEYDDLKTSFNTQMGFLTYPITFVSDMFNALTDTSNTWCNNTSCTKTFSGFFGSPFTIDFYSFKNISPTGWTYFLTIIRAMIILELILMLRKKYLKIASGGTHA